ncbi:MAG: hypothetical protein KIT73_13110, partial [Burkholderiales bacterium]|nr:hypothetical protein [Burkholderiales bacterium]
MGQRGWTAALLLAVWSAFALAADSGDAAPAARFEYFNRDIATFRVSLAGYGPSERAANARMRMQAILEQQGPGLVDIKTRDGARVIQLDGGTVFMLLPDDVDPLADENLDVIALAASRRLQEAVEASRESRSLAAWSWALGAVAAATAVGVVVVWLLGWARRRR